MPTLFFADGQSLFGPVVKDPPTGEDAIRLWGLVTGWLDFPHLYEIQRPKSRVDLGCNCRVVAALSCGARLGEHRQGPEDRLSRYQALPYRAIEVR